MLHKIGGYLANPPQQTKIPLDAIAVASGYAVWAKHVPTWVGIITIVWLGMQIIINLPRMFGALRHMFCRVTGCKCHCENCSKDK